MEKIRVGVVHTFLYSGNASHLDALQFQSPPAAYAAYITQCRRRLRVDSVNDSLEYFGSCAVDDAGEGEEARSGGHLIRIG